MKTGKILMTLSVLCMGLACTLQAASKEGGSSAMVYALPQTRLHVQLNVKHTVYKKGPYAEFASRMLGIQQLPANDSNTWEVVSARTWTSTETDNSELRSLMFKTTGDNLRNLLQITSAGIIADPQAGQVLSQTARNSDIAEEISFMNFTNKELTAERVDTFYKMIMNDTAFIRQPVVQRTLTSKSKESLARDVADQIFNIRENRLQLLIGNVDNYPDGNALQVALQALAEEENLLLSMFVGARYEETVPFNFSLVPSEPGSTDICWFSPENGIVRTSGKGTKAIACEVSTSFNGASDRPGNDTGRLIYRMPVQCDVTVTADTRTLEQSSHSFYQFGPYGSFPL